MSPRDLRSHKQALKTLSEVPPFKPCKRRKLERPFDRMGGSRLYTTDLVNVSESHVAVFFWKDGKLLTDTAFIAYLMCRLANRSLSPVFEFHWHPSHKGLHCRTPCRTKNDYTNRMLPGAPELNLRTPRKFDPREHTDRLQLIHIFCKACGITIRGVSAAGQMELSETPA